MTESKTLGGRPIRGEIGHYSRTHITEQRPIEDLLTALDAVFAFPEVEAVRWHQYTPYFNDGDVCEFTVHEPYFRIAGVDEEAGDYEDGFLDDWSIRYGNDPKYRDGETPRYPQVTHEILTAIQAFGKAVQSEAFDFDLKKHFGDPAEITATREGFDVEFYDHD